MGAVNEDLSNTDRAVSSVILRSIALGLIIIASMKPEDKEG